MSPSPIPDQAPRVCPISQLPARTLSWLWPSQLALGKLAMLDGDPGVGKSLLTLDLCARLTTGRPFPDGSPSPGIANAIVLNGEDSAEDTICHRLKALGADLDRVFVYRRQDFPTGELLRLPSATALLDEALQQTGARLVVIDPIVAFLDASVQIANDQTVRRALFPLYQLAERHQCVPLMVRHLNKSGRSRSLYRGGGSIGFAGACRMTWLLDRDPEDRSHRVLAQVKNNMAPLQPSLAFDVQGEVGGQPLLNWLGPCAWTADQLLEASAQAAPAARPRDLACEFLLDFLRDGPRTSRDLWTAARAQGLSDKTVGRAKIDLQIRSERVWQGGKLLSYWLLPDQQLPSAEPPDPGMINLETRLAELRKEYPPSTPLDNL